MKCDKQCYAENHCIPSTVEVACIHWFVILVGLKLPVKLSQNYSLDAMSKCMHYAVIR